MKTLFLTAAAATLLGAALATPSFAMTGAQAVAKCHKVHNCTPYVGPDGAIVIWGPKGGTVECPSKSSQCTATPRQGAATTRQDNIIDQAIQG